MKGKPNRCTSSAKAKALGDWRCVCIHQLIIDSSLRRYGRLVLYRCIIIDPEARWIVFADSLRGRLEMGSEWGQKEV